MWLDDFILLLALGNVVNIFLGKLHLPPFGLPPNLQCPPKPLKSFNVSQTTKPFHLAGIVRVLCEFERQMHYVTNT